MSVFAVAVVIAGGETVAERGVADLSHSHGVSLALQNVNCHLSIGLIDASEGIIGDAVAVKVEIQPGNIGTRAELLKLQTAVQTGFAIPETVRRTKNRQVAAPVAVNIVVSVVGDVKLPANFAVRVIDGVNVGVKFIRPQIGDLLCGDVERRGRNRPGSAADRAEIEQNRRGYADCAVPVNVSGTCAARQTGKSEVSRDLRLRGVQNDLTNASAARRNGGNFLCARKIGDKNLLRRNDSQSK